MHLSGHRDEVCGSSRRAFLSSTAALIAAVDVAIGARGGESIHSTDPAVSLWRDWLAAQRQYNEASRRQQKLETEMLRELGSFPRVKVVLSEDIGFMWAYSGKEIDRLLPNSDQDEIRRKARAELAARLHDWNAADTSIGYSRAKKAEAEIVAVEEALAKDLWMTRPNSSAGVAAKLHCVLEMEDPGSRLEDEPWPQLRMILSELVQVGAGRNPV
jgi:hypothetical protein